MGSFQKDNRYNQRTANFAVAGTTEADNVNYYDADCDISDYLGGRPLSRVNFKENDNNYP